MGTSSSAFVNASLFQLQAAARLPGGGISELAVNSALALIEAVAPKDEVEGALALQMACTHIAAMASWPGLRAGLERRDGQRCLPLQPPNWCGRMQRRSRLCGSRSGSRSPRCLSSTIFLAIAIGNRITAVG